jgi:hypothetical protein
MSRRSTPSGEPRIQIGAQVPIPCRSCGKAMIPFFVAEGTTLLRCGACGRTTEVVVSRVEGALAIRTRGAS